MGLRVDVLHSASQFCRYGVRFRAYGFKGLGLKGLGFMGLRV